MAELENKNESDMMQDALDAAHRIQKPVEESQLSFGDKIRAAKQKEADDLAARAEELVRRGVTVIRAGEVTAEGPLSPSLRAMSGKSEFPKRVPLAVDRRNAVAKDIAAENGLPSAESWRDESPTLTTIDKLSSVPPASTKFEKPPAQITHEADVAVARHLADERWQNNIDSVTNR